MLGSMPLAEYAAEYWIGHAKSGGVDPTTLQLILCLFTPESASFKNWIRIHNIEADEDNFENHRDLEKDKFHSTLYYSSRAGIQELTYGLLQKGENANAEGGIYGNPLQAASCEGYEVIVKLLLENGAEVNAEGGRYGNALQAASYRGNEAIVKLLLENGAEVNAEGGQYGNALQAALHGGNEAIVKLLLENGAVQR